MSALPADAVLPEGVMALIPGFLGRQRWYAGRAAPAREQVVLVAAEQLAVTGGGGHRLLWALVEVAGGGGDEGGERASEATSSSGATGSYEGPVEGLGGEAGDSGSASAVPSGPVARYQLLIGERPNGEPADFLNGREPSVLGSSGDHYYYDATLDSEMDLAWLDVATGGEVTAQQVRPVGAEQSNTSLVFDNRLIAKIFRKLADGPNPDIEVTEALARTGFEHVARPAAVWRKGPSDLAFVQQFLAGGTEGWAMALTSLRNLYACRPEDPCDAGGDFSHEASRLGRMTAEMHLAMAEAFGVDTEQFRFSGWPAVLDEVEARLRAVVGAAYSGSAAALVDHLRGASDPGPAIRVHGDYHLGQVMRTDSGWYVLDFEGEPARGLAQRTAYTSPFKDVAGMLRSFQYAAHFALLEHEAHEQEELGPLGDGWERVNCQAFLGGYFATNGIGDLLPQGSEARLTMALAFELQKALYELAYEQAYRPDWALIPKAAIQGLLQGSARSQGG